MPLPQEIVDLIIDRLADDCTETLQACTLVSKSWVDRSRTHLFRYLYLSSFNHRCWLKAVSVGDASPAIYVRTLYLAQYNEAPKWINPDDLDSFLPHLRDFKNVESLTLDGLEPSQFGEDELKKYFGPLGGKVRSLDLDRGATPDLLLGLLGIFPNLENLQINDIGGEETTRVPTVSPKLSGRLMIGCAWYTRSFLESLCKLPLRFREISLDRYSGGFQELIDACAETLVDFGAMYENLDEGTYDFSFEKCPKLREVRLVKKSFESPGADLTGIVSSITSRDIQRITIGFLSLVTDVQLRSVAESKTWQRFDDAVTELAEQALDNGRKLQVELRVCEDPSTGLFNPIFPRSLGSGCLKVVKSRYARGLVLYLPLLSRGINKFWLAFIKFSDPIYGLHRNQQVLSSAPWRTTPGFYGQQPSIAVVM